MRMPQTSSALALISISECSSFISTTSYVVGITMRARTTANPNTIAAILPTHATFATVLANVVPLPSLGTLATKAAYGTKASGASPR